MVIYTKEFLEPIIKECKNKAQILEKLNLPRNGNNNNMIQNYIDKYQIDISHFIKFRFSNNTFIKKPIIEILIENSTYNCSSTLKERLYKEGLKERKCEKCGQDENWHGEYMSLIIDHINGVNNDNRLENLRILCPNCNATLETHCRGAKKVNEQNNIELQLIKKEKINNKRYENKHDLCKCGNIKQKKSKVCMTCRDCTIKVKERPSLEQLELDIVELGYLGTGRKYGVSDNAIRKWLKKYKKDN